MAALTCNLSADGTLAPSAGTVCTTCCRLLLGGVLAAFYIMAALAVRDLSFNAIKESVLIRPHYGWCFGMGSALLWLISGFFACCEASASSLTLCSARFS